MKTKRSDRETITLKISEKGISCIMKYPKRSRLKLRCRIWDKMREMLFTE